MKKFETLFLHVGLEKTGTTSIQRALDVHRDEFEKLGYYYPQAFAVGRNTLLAAMFHPNPNKKPNFKLAIEKRGGTQEAHIAHMQALLESEFQRTQATNLVLSSEFIAAQCDIGALKSFCDQLAEKTKVVLYLREQGSLILSLHSTRVKGGGAEFGTLGHIENEVLPSFLDFKDIISRLEKHYDRSDIEVRLFDRRELVNGDAIDDFVSVIGVQAEKGEFWIDRLNESLSHTGIELLKEVNNYMPPIIESERNRGRLLLIDDMVELDGSGDFGKYTLSENQVATIGKLTKSTNEWVRKNYFKDRPNLFDTTGRTGKGEITPEQTIDYSARLLARAYERIWALERAAKRQGLKIGTDLLPFKSQSKVVTPAPRSGSHTTSHSNINRVIIHIGRHKSGTSTVQHFFKDNREFYDKAGILFPLSGTNKTTVAHHDIAMLCNQSVRENSKLLELSQGVSDEVKDHHNTILISSEAFQNLTKKKPLRQFLAPFSSAEIEVVCYVREFADYMVSSFRQAVQNQIRFQTFGEFSRHQYQVKLFLSLWSDIGNLKLRWFHPQLLKNSDVVDDFLEQNGLPDPNLREKPTKNPSIGGNLLWLKLAANKALIPFPGYSDMARLAQHRVEFREPFYIPEKRIASLRASTKYNKIFEKKLGPVPYETWEHNDSLPNDSRLAEDLKFLEDSFPKIDFRSLLAYQKEGRGWFV
ncbi:MAG: hypothetical protein HKN36_05460 [Hellea sp.]|nr:hypothetical protein [Hellea sp.]